MSKYVKKILYKLLFKNYIKCISTDFYNSKWKKKWFAWVLQKERWTTQMSLWMNNLNKHVQSCYGVPVSIFVIDLHWYFHSKLIILIHFQHNVIEQFKEILKTFKILKMINISSFKQHQCLFFFWLEKQLSTNIPNFLQPPKHTTHSMEMQDICSSRLMFSLRPAS